MVTRKDITRAAWDMAHEYARQMDFSGMDAQALHDVAMWAFGHLDIIKHEIFDWAWQVVNQPPICENPVLVDHCIDIARKAVPIWVYFRAFTIGAAREIEVRSKKNKTNYYFGLLKLAHHFKNIELQLKAWRPLRRILSNIPYKRGWSKHPEGKDGWLDVVNLAVTQLLNEYASIDPSSTLKGMVENRFRQVYKRVTARFIDEIRRLERKPKEISIVDVSVSNPVANEGLQRLAVINLIEEVASGYDEKDVGRVIIKKLETLLENPEQIPDDRREIRAEFVRYIAQNRGVSEQQARRDLREFEQRAKADETLERLRDEICELGRTRIVLREVQEAEED